MDAQVAHGVHDPLLHVWQLGRAAGHEPRRAQGDPADKVLLVREARVLQAANRRHRRRGHRLRRRRGAQAPAEVPGRAVLCCQHQGDGAHVSGQGEGADCAF